MLTTILLLIVLALLALILYAHHKHADALTEIAGGFASLRNAVEKHGDDDPAAPADVPAEPAPVAPATPAAKPPVDASVQG